MRANGRFYKHSPKFFPRAGLPVGCSPARCHWPESGALTATVLSNENPEAVERVLSFYEQRMGTAPSEPAADVETDPAAVESKDGKPAPAEGKSSEQQEQEQNPEGGTTPPGKVHVRFSELTEARKAAEAEAATAKAERDAERKARVLAEQRADELRAKHEPPKDPLGAEPRPDQFVNTSEFAEALKDWTTEKVKAETAETNRRAKLQSQWENQEAKAKAAIPDYDTVIAAGADLMLPNPVLDAIASSDQGPWIAHHLAKNPEVVSQIRGMDPGDRLRYIGKLEGKFEAASASGAPVATDKPAAKPAPAAAAEISRAPAPINPLRGSAAVTDEVPLNESGEFIGTAERYRELRRAGKIK